MNYSPKLLDKLAAEYVLGTLHGAARRRFARLVQQLPAAAAAVKDWEVRLAPLAEQVPAVAPSTGVWTRIEERLGWQVATTRSGVWAWLGGFASFAFGLVLAYGLMLFYPAQLMPRQTLSDAAPLPKYVGLISDAQGKPVFFATTGERPRELKVKVVQPVAVPDGKVLELWALPEGQAPVPLGVLPAKGKAVVAMNEDADFLKGISKLAVSIEDRPVASGAAPTTVILAGQCAQLW